MMKAFLRSFCVIVIVCVSFRDAGAVERLTLDQSVREALERNPRLKSLSHEIEAVESEFWDTVLPENPGFFAEVEGVPDGSPVSDYEARKIGVSQRFDSPWTYILARNEQRVRKKSAHSEYLSTRNGVVAEVTKRFYRVLMLEQKSAMYREIESLTRELLDKARVRVAAGETASYDTLRVRVDLADVENLVLSAERDRDAALYGLKLLLGRTREEPVEPEGELSYAPVAFDLDTLKERAMQSHPNLRSANAAVEEKRIEKSRAKASLIPSFELAYFNHSLPGSSHPNAWGGSVGLTIPLWGFLREGGRINAADRRLSAAGWHVEAVKRRVLLGVEEAYSTLLLADKQVRKYRESTLEEVGELVRIATRSYEEGEMGYIEVAEAYRSMHRVNAGYVEALYGYLAALADLENAVGEPLSPVK